MIGKVAASLAQLEKIFGLAADEIGRCLSELRDSGVCDVDENGVFFSRKMIRDTDLAQIRSEAGSLGAEVCHGKREKFCHGKKSETPPRQNVVSGSGNGSGSKPETEREKKETPTQRKEPETVEDAIGYGQIMVGLSRSTATDFVARWGVRRFVEACDLTAEARRAGKVHGNAADYLRGVVRKLR